MQPSSSARTARFWASTTRCTHAAKNVWVSSDGGFRRYPGVFEISAEVLEGFTNEWVEAMVWEELERVTIEPATEEKLAEVRRSLRNHYFRSIETNHDLASELARSQMIHGDWRDTYRRFEEDERVSAEDVTRLAGELFRRERATVVYLEPEDAGESGS